MVGVPEQARVQWSHIRSRLREELGDSTYDNWLAPIHLCSAAKDRISLGVPTRFLRDWVRAHYLNRLQDLWAEVDPAIRAIDLTVRPGLSDSAPAPSEAPLPTAASEVRRARAPMPAVTPKPVLRQPVGGVVGSVEQDDDLSAPLHPGYTFDKFVIGKPNEFAYAAARRVAESDSVPFNPLFLHSGVGLGKTHLMHAIAWEIRRRDPMRNVVYLSAEKFMYRFVRALRYQDTMAFKEQFRAVDVLMIDDVQFISGKDYTQEEFFHTFNALVDSGRQIVISADKSPTDLQGIEERLKSRLGYGLVADIHPTTYELRLGILEAKAEETGVAVDRKVLEFIAHRIAANVRELEGALRRVVAHAQLMQRPITLETTQEVLHDLLRAHDRVVTIEDIQKKVAQHFNIRLADMESTRKSRAVARPRQVAMFLAKQLTSRSLPDIGRQFGGRDHTTVMHACKKVDELIQTDQGFAEEVDLLRRALNG